MAARRLRDRNAGGRLHLTPEDEARLAWWREARFGMFIHWGLYAIPAGKWKGEDIPGIGEWIMHTARIPMAEYETLAARFNPTRFDADAWVGLAKRAGMKYLVITSKHHDGFAIYDSAVSDYDIVDATPFGRDVLAELAEACRKSGIRLCFYHSQDQDWHEPNASGNDWDDFAPPEERDFERYLREKVKPQLTELLTQYGPIGLIWFDTPMLISKAQSEHLRRFVHELQPDCLVSGRIGHGVGDYGSLGDNQIPPGRADGAWETPATMNDTWAFKTEDHKWKSTKTLLHLLADLAGKGINYLLNVGPTAEGEIPQPSVERLEAIGRWIEVNGEAIYGTSPSPYAYAFDWGGITQKGSTLYLLLTRWPGTRLTIFGLRTTVKSAYLLADPDKTLNVSQRRDDDLDHDVLELGLPSEAPDEHVSVVALELDGPAGVEAAPLQQPNGSIELLAGMADLHVPKRGSRIEVHPGGVIANWYNKANWMSWKFKVVDPGEFDVKVVTGTLRHYGVWEGGHRIRVSVGGSSVSGATTADEQTGGPRASYFPEHMTNLGRITIEGTGMHELKVRAEEINKSALGGVALASVRLERV
ncbi:MAG: alpha-L-fucosidase [Chloroflexi bacterium]|nr:alpha-L-fucosidase [Chloroflexota bacterium]MCY3937335.1 alpha-L-fucosidase [Chloroflexota bacterium]